MQKGIAALYETCARPETVEGEADEGTTAGL
jgi:hypothetical protein